MRVCGKVSVQQRAVFEAEADAQMRGEARFYEQEADVYKVSSIDLLYWETRT